MRRSKCKTHLKFRNLFLRSRLAIITFVGFGEAISKNRRCAFVEFSEFFLVVFRSTLSYTIYYEISRELRKRQLGCGVIGQ